MKQKILVLLLLYFILWGWVFADDCQKSCKIQDGPASVLQTYLNNLDIVIRNTLSEAKGKKTEPSDRKKIQNEILAQMSKVIDFGSYYSSFDYYVAVPITNEVPEQVKRDHELLNKQTERLTNLLERAIRAWYGEAVVENPCEGVEDSCKVLERWNVRGILTALIANNKEIVSFYRFSIVDQRNYADADFILVPDNFEGEMGAYYNKDTLTDCSLCDGAFFDTVKTSIENIGQNSGKNNEGIRKWKEAWALLTGAVGQSNYTKKEDELVRKHLGTEWLNGSAADSVTDNLARYNSGGLSTSNPLFNSANYTMSKTREDGKVFQTAISDILDTNQEIIPIKTIQENISKTRTSQDIQNEIASVLTDQAQFATVQDTGSEKIIAKIVRMHYSLVRSINVLDKNVKVSEEVCDSQWQWLWKCSYH